jgi:hypothetical protein
MYSSVVPDPEVDLVQAGVDEVDVADTRSAGRLAGVVGTMEVGYGVTPDTPVELTSP